MYVDEFFEELRDLAEIKSHSLIDHICLAWAIQAMASAGNLLDQYGVEMFGNKRLNKDLQQELGWEAL